MYACGGVHATLVALGVGTGVVGPRSPATAHAPSLLSVMVYVPVILRCVRLQWSVGCCHLRCTRTWRPATLMPGLTGCPPQLNRPSASGGLFSGGQACSAELKPAVPLHSPLSSLQHSRTGKLPTDLDELHWPSWCVTRCATRQLITDEARRSESAMGRLDRLSAPP